MGHPGREIMSSAAANSGRCDGLCILAAKGPSALESASEGANVRGTFQRRSFLGEACLCEVCSLHLHDFDLIQILPAHAPGVIGAGDRHGRRGAPPAVVPLKPCKGAGGAHLCCKPCTYTGLMRPLTLQYREEAPYIRIDMVLRVHRHRPGKAAEQCRCRKNQRHCSQWCASTAGTCTDLRETGKRYSREATRRVRHVLADVHTLTTYGILEVRADLGIGCMETLRPQLETCTVLIVVAAVL